MTDTNLFLKLSLNTHYSTKYYIYCNSTDNMGILFIKKIHFLSTSSSLALLFLFYTRFKVKHT